jgi:hypothetical protein
MDFPSLENWQSTRAALHDAAMILSVLQVGTVEPRPYAMQYSLDYTDTGLSTYALPYGTLQLDLRWVPGLLHIKLDADDDVSYSLDGYSQVQLMQAVLGTLKEHGIEPTYNADHVQNDRDFVVQTSLISSFGTVLDNMFTVFARTRARLLGYMTPAVVFAHHFDLSFMWFKDPTRTDDHTDAHVNIGFSPGDAAISRPYIYVYGWSEAGGYLHDAFKLPSLASWEQDAFTGARIDYDALRALPRPDSTLEQVLLRVASGMMAAL